MKTYIYKGAQDFYYRDVCIAKLGETLEIEAEGIRNISNNKFNKVPSEFIEDLLKNCEEYDPESGIDIDEINFTGLFNEINNSGIRRFIQINHNTIFELINLGILKTTEDSCRSYNVGKSNYSKHIIQPWAIWQDYNLNPWDADIVKRILRTKSEEGLTEIESRVLDYQKIIHICQERIRQLNGNV